MKKIFAFAAIGLVLTGCTTYQYHEIYPELYSDLNTKRDDPIPADSLPPFILNSLPIDFQIAHFSGHLWCYLDWNGQYTLRKFPSKTATSKPSSEFLDSVKIALEANDRLVHIPAAYPNIACLRPASNLNNLLDEDYFSQWLLFFQEWDDAEVENKRIGAQTTALVITISEVQKAIALASTQEKELDTKIASRERDLIEVTNSVAAVLAQINAVGLLDRLFETPKPLPPFDPKIKYEFKNDMFAWILDKYLINYSDKKYEWATDQMEGGKYLDIDLGTAIQQVHAAFKNPSRIEDDELRSDVQDLIDAGFKNIYVTSGARSPYRQAHLYYEAKRNSNPVAKYVSSEHMFGAACDIGIFGFEWGSSNHNKLRRVLKRFNLDIPVEDDPVHLQLVKTTAAYAERRLWMMRTYLQFASNLRTGQVAVKASHLALFNDFKSQSATLEKDLQARMSQIHAKTDLFERISAAYAAQFRQLQKANQDLAAAKRRARLSNDSGRDGGGVGRGRRFNGNTGNGGGSSPNSPSTGSPSTGSPGTGSPSGSNSGGSGPSISFPNGRLWPLS